MAILRPLSKILGQDELAPSRIKEVMTQISRTTKSNSKRQCGPTLMISIVALVVIALVALMLFQRNQKTMAQPAAHPINATMPTQ